MRDTHTLLRLLTEFIPPPDGCKHAITMGDEGHLIISMRIGDVWQDVRLDGPDDLEKNPHEVFEEVERLFKEAGIVS